MSIRRKTLINQSIIFFTMSIADINECKNNPCVNGVCVNTNGGFTCSCYAGWTGLRCDIGNSIHLCLERISITFSAFFLKKR